MPFIPEQSVEARINHDYDEVSDLHIRWRDIFRMPEDDYFVYFYARHCAHCQDLKNEIIEFALHGPKKIYFVLEGREHVFIEESTSVIGVTDIKDFGILGYPTLTRFVKKTVTLSVAGLEPIRLVLASVRED